MSERITEEELARIVVENEEGSYGSQDAVRLVAEVRRLRELILLWWDSDPDEGPLALNPLEDEAEAIRAEMKPKG